MEGEEWEGCRSIMCILDGLSLTTRDKNRLRKDQINGEKGSHFSDGVGKERNNMTKECGRCCYR